MWQLCLGLKILEWRIPNDTDFRNLLAHFLLKYDRLYQLIIEEFGPNGLYILAAFTFFLIVLIVIYCKSVIETLRSVNATKKTFDNTTADNSFYISEPTEELHTFIANDNLLENAFLNDEETDSIEQEKELSKDLVRVSALTADYLHLSEDYKRLKSIMKKHAETEKENLQKSVADTKNDMQQLMQPVKEDSETIKVQRMSDLISLVLNLLGRHVSEQKIVQTVYFYNNYHLSAEEILQIVHTIRNFIAICNTGKFDLLPERQKYPQNQEALYALATGNPSPCLILMQLLLNQYMKRAEREAGIFQEMTYAQAANCACILGNIALLSDVELAHNSFELATELSPHSVNAWSRLADTYLQENLPQKAMIAYQTVLDLADSPIYSEQIANAQTRLAQYYETQGMTDRAKQYQTKSATYYGTYGITTPLSEQEVATFETIRENMNINLQPTIISLLHADSYSR